MKYTKTALSAILILAIAALQPVVFAKDTSVLDRDDSPKVREIYEMYVLNEDNPAYALNNEGNLYAITGDIESAKERYREALKLDPVSTLILNNLAWMLIVGGEYDEALTVLTQSMLIDDENPSALFYAGVVKYQMSELSEAKRNLVASILLEPSNPYVHYYLARVYEAEDDIENALVEAETAAYILGDVWNPDVALFLGDVYGKAEMFQKAILQYQKLVDDPEYAFDAYYSLGVSYGRYGDFEKAEANFLKALDLDKKNPAVHYGLGKLYSTKDDLLKKSLSHAEEALSSDPEDPEYLYLVGCVYYRMEDMERAHEYISRALEQDPDNETYRYQKRVLEQDYLGN